MLERLFKLRQPTEPVSYGHRVRDMYSKILSQEGSFDSLEAARRLELAENLLTEIVRISNMPSGDQTAFDLSLDLKLDILPSGSQDHLFNLLLHDRIHERLLAILEKQNLPHSKPSFSLAAASRRTKKRMQIVPCYAQRRNDNACLYNVLLPTLDLLQRYAYFEIQHNVRLAVRDRLPAELADLVFENTLDAEGINRDPRIIVRATDTSADAMWKGTVLEKCIAPCRHDYPGSGRPGASRGGIDYVHVLGPNYKECLPMIPRSITSHEELLEAEFTAEAG
jgi:hypothetical protein